MATWTASQRVQWAIGAVDVALRPGIQDIHDEGLFRFPNMESRAILTEINESFQREMNEFKEKKAQEDIKHLKL